MTSVIYTLGAFIRCHMTRITESGKATYVPFWQSCQNVRVSYYEKSHYQKLKSIQPIVIILNQEKRKFNEVVRDVIVFLLVNLYFICSKRYYGNDGFFFRFFTGKSMYEKGSYIIMV